MLWLWHSISISERAKGDVYYDYISDGRLSAVWRAPRRPGRARAVLIGGTVLALWATLPYRPRPEEGTAGPVSASAALRGDPAANEGYARAHTPRPLRFPDDHGPHPEFRTEWWYFTCNPDGAKAGPSGIN